MKQRFLFALLFLVLVSILGACQSDQEKEEKLKKKYDQSINHVIEMENDRLKEGNIPLERKDIGIVVYEEGKIIQLFYDFKNKKIDGTYEKIGNEYTYISDPDTIDKKTKNLEEDYMENIGKK